MSSNNQLSTLVESVAAFRPRATAVFHTWASVWLRLTGDPRNTRDRATLLAAIIQVLYWSVMRRNPTVTEWASAVDRYSRLSLSPSLIRRDLELAVADGAHVDDELNIMKPWWAFYQMAGQDEAVAVRNYATCVGTAFLSLRVPEAARFLTPDEDWTREDAIEAVIRRALTVPKKTSWWKRVFS